MPHIDTKVTVWERLYFSTVEEMKEAINNYLETGSYYDLIENVSSSEILLDTMTHVEVSENKNKPTVEAYLDDMPDVFWDNVNQK
jgi:hypothetical protein